MSELSTLNWMLILFAKKVLTGVLQLVYLPSASQIADILTKAVQPGLFSHLKAKMSMINIHAPLVGEYQRNLLLLDKIT